MKTYKDRVEIEEFSVWTRQYRINTVEQLQWFLYDKPKDKPISELFEVSFLGNDNIIHPTCLVPAGKPTRLCLTIDPRDIRGLKFNYKKKVKEEKEDNR